jgi:hypothetical protein
MVREFERYRVAVYSPSSHFAVITPLGSNRVIDLKERQPRATVGKGPLACLERAEALVKVLIAEGIDQGQFSITVAE